MVDQEFGTAHHLIGDDQLSTLAIPEAVQFGYLESDMLTLDAEWRSLTAMVHSRQAHRDQALANSVSVSTVYFASR